MALPRLIAILDANVLYPFFQRDLLLNLAYEEMYIPKWSDEIEREWVQNLKANRPDISSNLDRTLTLMDKAFPDAKVHGYEKHIHTLALPDKDDRHVLAAAIECKADVIVTYNLDDFPEEKLSGHDISAFFPDQFISLIIDSNPLLLRNALEAMVKVRKNPPVSLEELIGLIAERGMPESAAKIKRLLNL